jgi:hypothetical protein
LAFSSSAALTGWSRSRAIFRQEQALDVFDLRVRAHRREGVEDARVGQLPVGALGRQRLLRVVHETSIQTARAPPRQDLAGDVERLGVRVPGGRRVPGSREQRAAHVHVDDLSALAALLGLAGRIARDRVLRLETAERAADVRQGLLGIEVADDRDPQIVGRIVGPEETATDLDRGRLDVAAPADHRCAVGVRGERQRHQRLEGAPLRIVLAAQAALLEHHLAFAVERLLADVEVRDPLP